MTLDQGIRVFSLAVLAAALVPRPAAGRELDYRAPAGCPSEVEVSTSLEARAPTGRDARIDVIPDGTTVTGAIGFEAGAGAAPPFVTWQRSNGGHPAGRTVRIEYVGADGAAILELQLARCVPTAVVPQGANGTTRIAVTCGALRAG